MIEITPTIAVDPREISESFVRSPGPGGQKVNKVATAVQLRFDLRRSPSLPEDVRERFRARFGRRISREGELIDLAHHGLLDEPRPEFRAVYLEYLLDHADERYWDAAHLERLMDRETDHLCYDLFRQLLKLSRV